jgi:acetyl esterase/lipase
VIRPLHYLCSQIDIGYRTPNARSLYTQTGSNVLLVDYRSYGNSDEATLTEPGLRRDAQASLDWLRARTDIDHKKIFVLGSSLGGAVSIALAHSNPDKVCHTRPHPSTIPLCTCL